MKGNNKEYKFKIHDYNWTLEFIKKQVSCGETDYSKCKIVINTDQVEQVVLHSIIHEITHAYRWSYGYQNDEDDRKLECDQLEEEIANFMETWGDEIITVSKKMYSQYLESLKTITIDIKNVEVIKPEKKKKVKQVEETKKEKKNGKKI